MSRWLETRRHRRGGLSIVGALVGLGLVVGAQLYWIAPTRASTPITAGYLGANFPSGVGGNGDATAEKPESKLWYNDGLWWAVMYHQPASEFRIFRLDWATQSSRPLDRISSPSRRMTRRRAARGGPGLRRCASLTVRRRPGGVSADDSVCRWPRSRTRPRTWYSRRRAGHTWT